MPDDDDGESFDLSDMSSDESDGGSSGEETIARTRGPSNKRTQAPGAAGHDQTTDERVIMETQLENQRLREAIRNLQMMQVPTNKKKRAKPSSRTHPSDTNGLQSRTDSTSRRGISPGVPFATSVSPSPSLSSAASSATGVVAGQGEEKQITSYAASFAVTCELFLEKHPIPPEDKYKRHREKVIAAELILSLPDHLRAALDDSTRHVTFKNMFVSKHQQERANLVRDARALAPLALVTFFVDKIPDPQDDKKRILPPGVHGPGTTFFESSAAAGSQRAQHPRLRQLFHNPEKPMERYPVWPAMIFEDHNTDGPGVFLAEELIALWKHMIFKSAGTPDGAGSSGRKSGRQSKGKQWGLTKTTPAMIATSAVLAQFVCSEDTTFHSTDQTGPSGVSWRARWNLYKQTLLSLPDNFRQVLLSRWDAELFAARPTPEGSGGNPSKAEEVSDFHRFVHRMRTTDARPAESVRQQLDNPISLSPIQGTPLDIPAVSVTHAPATSMPASVSVSTPMSGPLLASLSPLPPPTPAPVKTHHTPGTSEVAETGSVDMSNLEVQVEVLTVKPKSTKTKARRRVPGPVVTDAQSGVDLLQVEVEDSVQVPSRRQSSRQAQKKTG
ncbi:hypothetical protein BC834DRAFT_975855 [Gloeopeniophorella convolvens]|nr:hypothetical protein BC834DRAFT_975855 [Gloeopeniophorella convolvens]